MRARVLVVDDDEMYLAGIKELLEQAGYETFVASSFEDGKRELQNREPDLLILDVRLGAFNGLQLISTGRAAVPAIVITGFDDTVLRADANEFGASYVVKPVVPATLLALIEQKLGPLGAADSGDPHALLVRETPGTPAPATERGGVSGSGGAPLLDSD
jgi:DNA-binding response OmpR family regulator